MTQHPKNRRVFMLQLVCGGTALASGGAALADEPKAKLTESDSYARSMGFRLDTTKVDQARFPRHSVDQKCSTCQLFSGKDGEEWGPCSFFGGRLVHRDGWCRNFKVRKAA
jgi:hypothetical protein